MLDLGGKPLILHAVDVALAANSFGRVLVTTDDSEIKDIVLNRDTVTVDDRESSLAGDTVKVIDVICDIIERPDVKELYDVVGMLLPTCPLRTPKQVREGFDALEEGFDATISFTDYEFPPSMAVTFDENGVMIPLYDSSPLTTGNTRTQDQVPVYRPNGAFFFTWIKSLRRFRSFYKGRVKGVLMPRANSVDIDNRQDLEYANFLVSGNFADPNETNPK